VFWTGPHPTHRKRAAAEHAAGLHGPGEVLRWGEYGKVESVQAILSATHRNYPASVAG
jgi:hypothetical protein